MRKKMVLGLVIIILIGLVSLGFNIVEYLDSEGSKGLFKTDNPKDFTFEYASQGITREQYQHLNSLLYSYGLRVNLDARDSLIIGLDYYTENGALQRYSETQSIRIEGISLDTPEEYNLILVNRVVGNTSSFRNIIIGLLAGICLCGIIGCIIGVFKINKLIQIGRDS